MFLKHADRLLSRLEPPNSSLRKKWSAYYFKFQSLGLFPMDRFFTGMGRELYQILQKRVFRLKRHWPHQKKLLLHCSCYRALPREMLQHVMSRLSMSPNTLVSFVFEFYLSAVSFLKASVGQCEIHSLAQSPWKDCLWRAWSDAQPTCQCCKATERRGTWGHWCPCWDSEWQKAVLSHAY